MTKFQQRHAKSLADLELFARIIEHETEQSPDTERAAKLVVVRDHLDRAGEILETL